MGALPTIALVTQTTSMESLQARFGTKNAIRFRMKRAAVAEADMQVGKFSRAGVDEELIEDNAQNLSDAEDLEEEDKVYQYNLKKLMNQLDLGYPVMKVNRKQIPNTWFDNCYAVVVYGRDGLVANVAKYARGVPIIGVNPDHRRYDGILLPFAPKDVRRILQKTIDNQSKINKVTMGKVSTNDGQEMFAFNDFYVGSKTHVSARYTIQQEMNSESQSSSGVILSTGSGATGWMSSVFNMANAIAGFCQSSAFQAPSFSPVDEKIFWAVREPFLSKDSGIDLTAGVLNREDELIIGSRMAKDGVIFSDGIESDYIEFNSGSIARFQVACEKANLVVG